MKRKYLPLAIVFILGTGCASRTSNAELLSNCWQATPANSANEYLIEFEAIVFRGIEGGVYARSRDCPDHRLRIDYVSAEIDRQVIEIVNSAEDRPVLGVGVRARAQVTIKERRDEHHMTVLITHLFDLRAMSDEETRQFISHFSIG